MGGINQLSPGTQHSTFAFDSQKIKKLRELYISLQNQGEVQTRFSDPLSQEGNTVKSRALIDATKDDIKLIIGQNTSAILNKVIETAPEYNKGKEEILKTFIDSHILSLNIEEDNYLLSNLYYFLRLVESYDFGGSELLDDIISEPEFFNKKTILYELLYNYVYLPDYEKSNQELFDLEMLALLDRIEQRVTKYRTGKVPVVIPNPPPKQILNYLYNFGSHIVLGGQKIDSGIIKYISYKFNLGNNLEYNEMNQFSMSFVFRNDGVGRISFIDYLENKLQLKKIGDREFVLGFDATFKYAIHVGNEMYQAGDEGEYHVGEEGLNEDLKNIGFEVIVYAEAIKDLSTEEELSSVCYKLPGKVELLLDKIYKEFGEDEKGFNGYPEKPVIFDIRNLLNAEAQGDGTLSDMAESRYFRKSYLHLGASSDTSDTSSKQKFNFVRINEAPELILDERVRLEIDKFVDRINNSEKYAKFGLGFPKGLLLYGASGTGKTSIAKYIAAKTNEKTVFVEVLIDTIKGMYVGDSEKGVRMLWSQMREEVRKGKIVIGFLDEIDGLMGSGERKDDVESGMRSIMLSEFQGVEEEKNQGIVLVGATNFLENLSKALVRRFTKTIEVKLPSDDERIQLIDLYKNKLDKDLFEDFGEQDYLKLIRETNGVSHAFYKVWFEFIIEHYVYTGFEGKIDADYMISQIELAKSKTEEEKKAGFIK